MSDELKTQLTQLLGALLTNVQNAAGWAGGQIPLLIQEKILVDRIFLTVVFLVCLVVFVGSVKLIFYCTTKLENCGWRKEGKYVAGNIVGVVFAVASLIVTIAASYDLFLVWFAPRLYILNWLRGMI